MVYRLVFSHVGRCLPKINGGLLATSSAVTESNRLVDNLSFESHQKLSGTNNLKKNAENFVNELFKPLKSWLLYLIPSLYIHAKRVFSEENLPTSLYTARALSVAPPPLMGFLVWFRFNVYKPVVDDRNPESMTKCVISGRLKLKTPSQ